MKELAEKIKTKRKSLRLSREKLAAVAGMSASTVGRAEKSHPSVTREVYDSLQLALAVVERERRPAERAAPSADLAGEVERHARALLELAERLRDQK